MNPQQSGFHDFLMSLVAPGNEAAAEAILANSFAAQDGGRLTPDAVTQAVAALTPLLRPEAVPQLQAAAARMQAIAEHAEGGAGWGHHDHDGRHGHGGPDGMHHHGWGPDGQPMQVSEDKPDVPPEQVAGA